MATIAASDVTADLLKPDKIALDSVSQPKDEPQFYVGERDPESTVAMVGDLYFRDDGVNTQVYTYSFSSTGNKEWIIT